MDPASVCFHAPIASSTKCTSKLAHQSPPSISIIMADWMNQMADAVDAAEAANARAQDEVATEPATSPRSQFREIPEYLEELRLPSLEYGPHPEPERWVTRWITRDDCAPEEWEEYFRKYRQTFNNYDMERERQQAEAAENEAHERSIKEWEAQMKAQGMDHPALPSGPTPQGISSQRVLPRVHEALRQNDPSVTSYSQPAVKKAPPTSGRPMPSVFHSESEPPRIGSGVPPPPPAAPRPKVVPSIALPLAATPMTPSHPPRPPLSALPKHSSMETSSGASKHALDPPTAQAPPSKQVRCKAFPGSSQPPDQVYVAASATLEMPQSCRPCPKGPPATFLPTPPEIASMKADSYEENRKARLNEEGLYVRVKYPSEIDWTTPLHEQLAAVLKGGPSPNKSQDELRALRAKIPDLTKAQFENLFPADNVITATQKNHAVHKIHMSEPAAWVLNATHWFSLLDQPMMIVIWCHNWEDASKFQYMMQILQAQYGDFAPRYQIVMFDDSKIYGPCLQWQEPTTIWDGTPVQRRFLMIYLPLASRTSTPCGHILLLPSINAGML